MSKGSDFRWFRILTRTAHRAFADGFTTIASGVAFFVVLAIFPGIAAIVALYSLFAGPSLVEALLGTLPSMLPDYAVQVIARQVRYTSGAVDKPWSDLAADVVP
jgi:membrane protein